MTHAARELLEAAATLDEVPAALVELLVDAVLAGPAVALALHVRASSGPRSLALALALRLAALVLRTDYATATGERR